MKKPLRWLAIPAALLICGAILGDSQVRADTNRGAEIFEKRCGGCHSLDTVKAGPTLRGIFGHPVGKRAGFPYSDALKASRLTWDETTLDKWLSDPDGLIPGNDMAFRMNNGTERAAIIAYLKQLR